MSKIYPWDYHPDLTAERLATVARLIADGRQAAVERFDEEAGDDGWSLGVRAYQFVYARIRRNAESGITPWLKIIDRTRHLIFQVGEVPVRFYKGEAHKPTDRTLHQSFDELRQLKFVFNNGDEGGDLTYRFAVETHIDGSVLAVKFVGLRGETPVLVWDVPLDGDSLAVGTVGREATESVELGAPPVGVRGSVVETGDSSAS